MLYASGETIVIANQLFKSAYNYPPLGKRKNPLDSISTQSHQLQLRVWILQRNHIITGEIRSHNN